MWSICLLYRERQTLEAQCASLSASEAEAESSLAATVAAADTLAQTARNLVTQRSLAERYVSDRSDTRAALRQQLTEVSNAVKTRKATVETLRSQVASQQITIRVR